MSNAYELCEPGQNSLGKHVTREFQVMVGENGIPRRPVGNSIPLSFSQQQLWLLVQSLPNPSIYNECVTLYLPGVLDVSILEQSLNEIIRRHEAWRTSFPLIDGQPMQMLYPKLSLPISLVDLRELREDERESAAVQVAIEETRRPFDLANGPLLRATLVRLGEQEQRLYLSLHRIIFDSIALSEVFLPELQALYEAFSTNQPSPLPELPIQYADFAVWQRTLLQATTLTDLLDDWKQQFHDAPAALELPADRARPRIPTYQGRVHRYTLSQHLSENLKALSLREGVSLFIVLASAFQVLLYHYTDQNDLLIGTNVAERVQPEVRQLLGYFQNTLMLRTRLSDDLSFRDLLKQVSEVFAAASLRQEVPFEVLARELQQDSSLHQMPRIKVILATEPISPVFASGWTLVPREIDTGYAKFDLIHAFEDSVEGVFGRFEYATDLFDESTMSRMEGHWQMLLESIVANPEQGVGQLTLVTPAERQLLLVEWNAAQATYLQDQWVPQLFEAQAERTPDALAAVCEGEQLTYRELNERANRLAHYLYSLGVRPEMLVGICLDRTLEMLIGILAILKAGGAYVPLDPGNPPEHLAFILQDTQMPLLLTQQQWCSRLPERQTQLICLDTAREAISQQSEANLASEVKGEHLAYVVYTSGSTGRPKGTLIEHRAFSHHCQTITRVYELQASDRMLQFSAFTFDVSLEQMVPTLLAGATVVLRGSQVWSPDELVQKIRQEKLSVLSLPQPYWRQVMQEMASNAHYKEPNNVRLMVVGGDRFAAEDVPLWQQTALREARLLNAYGPTEAVMATTIYEVPRQGDGNEIIPIGRPFPNRKVYILDRHGNCVPIGVAGELYIGGDLLARGYLNRAELTAERFIPDPFSADPQARLYKTGDIVRYRSDGNIEFLGRIDDQVKIRGFRVELGEIEQVLRQHPGVQEVVVIAREDIPGDKRLVAYVHLRQEQKITERDLESYLLQHVPGYMIPSAFVLLEAFQLTSHGKIDRKVLPAPVYSRGVEPGQDFVPPRTPLEIQLTTIWSQVLGIETISVHDNFFDLGGHSLLAMQVITQMLHVLHRQIPLRMLFEMPTIAQLAHGLMQEMERSSVADVAAIHAVPRHLHRSRRDLVEGQQNASRGDSSEVVVMPTSLVQQSLWLVYQSDPTSTAYNLSLTLCLKAQLNVLALEQSVQTLVERHEILRTTFVLFDGQPMQVIAPTMGIPIAIVDVQNLSQQQREAQVHRLLLQEMQKPFDLAQGPLLRVLVLQQEPDNVLLLLVMHHIIFDGWSAGVLCRELPCLYDAFSSQQRASLAALPIQYADFAFWQREQMQQEQQEAHLAYWKQQLADAPLILQLPTDYPRPATTSHRGATYRFTLSRVLTEKLRVFSRQEGVTLYITLIAAFQLLLSRYTGQDDLVIGTVSAGRSRPETKDLVGYFVNTLALRADLTGNPTVHELLAHTRDKVLDAQAHQDVPFEQVVKELSLERSLDRHPVFQVMLTLDPPLPEVPAPWEVQPVDLETGACKFDLFLEIAEQADTLFGSLEYSTDLYEEATIVRMMEHWQILLDGLATNPDQRVRLLPLLTDAERRQMLITWNATQAAYPLDQCIHQLFERQVERTPDAVAAFYEDERITYRELNKRANQLAHHLQALGVTSEMLVGVCMERSLDLLVGLLGTLKAGGAYVPLDPTYPRERLAFMLQDSQLQILLTQHRLIEMLPEQRPSVICLDTEAELEQRSQENPIAEGHGENLAYVVYTSGSTGRPKGVLATHRAAINRFSWMWEHFPFESDEICCQKTSLSFVDSVWEIFGPLLQGIPTVLIPDEVLKEPQQLLRTLAAYQVTRIVLVPSLLQALLNTANDLQRQLPKLKYWVSSGEALSVELVQRFQDCLPHAVLLNLYGSSEVAADATYYEIRNGNALRSVPLGRPIANTQIYLLDTFLQPVPIGVAGELYVGGAGLVRGYLNRPELTAEKFVANPFALEADSYLYRTGDLARYLSDGNIEYLGRLDHQVKLRGFRIELEEIEAVLRKYPAVREAVVIVREDALDDKYLIAYILMDEGKAAKESELRSHVLHYVPAYMLPSAFVLLETLPLLPNGKIDRHALPTPEATQWLMGKAFVAPTQVIQYRLLSIWEDLLDARPIGIRDNFFYIGGHSLLAARLVDRIEQVFNTRIPLSMLFTHPTIEQLAQVLEEEKGEDESSRPSLLTIRAGGSKIPFFYLHGDWTDGGFYSFELARTLGPDQPFYLLEPNELIGIAVPPTIEEMAEANVRLMRSVQPEGPYRIGGFCNGALVAYEMAQQLHAQGQVVDALVLIELSTPPAYQWFHKIFRRFCTMLQLRQERQLALFLRVRYLYKHTLKFWHDWMSRGVSVESTSSFSASREALNQEYMGIFDWICATYKPGSYVGKVTFFWAADEFRKRETWLQIAKAQKAEVHTIPGTHETCRTDHAHSLAEYVSRCLNT